MTNISSAPSLLSTAHGNRYTKPEKKVLRNWFKVIYAPAMRTSGDELARRWALAQLIMDRQVDGYIFVHVDSTDCDHCRSTSVDKIPATMRAYEKFRDDQYEWAEGPTHVGIMTPSEAADFEPSFRDYIMEAHEDGHPYSVAG